MKRTNIDATQLELADTVVAIKRDIGITCR